MNALLLLILIISIREYICFNLSVTQTLPHWFQASSLLTSQPLKALIVCFLTITVIALQLTDASAAARASSSPDTEIRLVS